MALFYMKGCSNLSCNCDCNHWFRTYYARYAKYVKQHHWKILLAGLAFLGLCWLGFKSVDIERDLIKLWIYNSSRLHNETTYISQHSSSHIDQDSTETIIQVSKENILLPQFLLEHLQLLKLIVNITVAYNNRVFTMQDLCRQIHLPRMHYIDKSLRMDIENMMPCQIVTPLNCFWEGSKLLNKDSRINTSGGDRINSIKIDWTTLDFQNILNSFNNSWNKDFFWKLFNETGIDRGYKTKSCIDTSDPHCPNKYKQTLNIEEILSKGCFQVAKILYNYPKSVFVGEHKHAIQSLIFLRSAADIFQTMGSKDLDWSEDEVQKVIAMWQSKLRQTVIKYDRKRPYLDSFRYRDIPFQTKRVEKSSFYTFTNNSLAIALDEAGSDGTILTKYLVSVALVMLFVVIIFLSSDDPVRSHCWLAISGTILVIISLVAGLGLSAAVGLKFSVLTMQVIPFIMLGLGIDDVLILTDSYSRCMDLAEDLMVHPLYQTLHNSATVILLSFLVKVSIVGALLFIPVPLMRNFCGQVLLITILQTGTVVVLYPCMLYLDNVRQHNNRLDVLCCLLRRLSENPSLEDLSLPNYDPPSTRPNLTSSQVVFSTEFTTSPDNLVPNNVRQYVEINPIINMIQHPKSPSRQRGNLPEIRVCRTKKSRCGWKFRYWVSNTFLHVIALVPVHITIILLTLVIVVLGIYSTININCGLNLSSIFIQDSNEYNYINYEFSEFRMNNFDILTKNINYIESQELILQLNNEIKAVKNVQIFGNGKFWLSSLIMWLEKLQYDLGNDMKHKFIWPNGTWLTNASKNGLLAMTLLVQDHGSINYRKLHTTKLVHSHRVDYTNFYLYLNVWRSASADYDTIPCILYPQMKPFNVENFIPNSEKKEPSVIRMSGENLYHNNPLQFVTCKYFHRGVHEKNELSFVKTIRTITSRFTEEGITSIPLGNLFSLTEQYLSLHYQIMIAAIISVVCVFLVAFITMNHLLVTVLICLLLSSSLFSPFYFLNIYHLPLNGTSGVMALWSGGLGIRLSLFVIVSYTENSVSESPNVPVDVTDQDCGSIITIGKQAQMQIKQAINTSPCGTVLISTLLSYAFISMSNVTFIWEHFLLLPLIGMIHSLFNCYFLTPVLCFYLLPSTQIVTTSIKHPPRKVQRTTSNLRSHSRHKPRKGTYKMEFDKNSIHEKLSTIPEESSSIKSSIKSHTSKENLNQASSSQTQEYPKYVEQTVESSLTVLYPHISTISNPEMSLKTSFKYSKPMNAGK